VLKVDRNLSASESRVLHNAIYDAQALAYSDRGDPLPEMSKFKANQLQMKAPS
jgi:hypothetical protein